MHALKKENKQSTKAEIHLNARRVRWVNMKYARGKNKWKTSRTIGFCEYRHEISGSIKGEEFIDQLSDYQFLKKNSALWS
jgi:hypothetical protein